FKSGICSRDKEKLWTMLIKESQNRFEARVEEKIKTVVEEARCAYKQIQFGADSFQPQASHRRTIVVEKPLLGEGVMHEETESSSSSSSAQPNALRLRRRALMAKGADRSTITSQAVAESIARVSKIVLPSGLRAKD